MKEIASCIFGFIMGGIVTAIIATCYWQYCETKRATDERIAKLEKHTAKRFKSIEGDTGRRLARLEQEIGVAEEEIPF